MSSDRFPDIGAVVSDAQFPVMDTALRRGKHIHRDLVDEYEWLLDAQACLEPFYQGYGCELVHRSEGYFFLLPVSDAMASRQMSLAEMVVGQGLALCYLDPAALEGGGVIAREELLGKLASVMGPDVLMHTFNPKKKRIDERVAQKVVRQKVAEGLRKLSALGFVEVVEGERLKLRPSLMRFAEPVRGLPNAQEAMQALIAKGEVASHAAEEEPVEVSPEDEGERSLALGDSGVDEVAEATEELDWARAAEDEAEQWLAPSASDSVASEGDEAGASHASGSAVPNREVPEQEATEGAEERDPEALVPDEVESSS